LSKESVKKKQKASNNSSIENLDDDEDKNNDNGRVSLSRIYDAATKVTLGKRPEKKKADEQFEEFTEDEDEEKKDTEDDVIETTPQQQSTTISPLSTISNSTDVTVITATSSSSSITISDEIHDYLMEPLDESLFTADFHPLPSYWKERFPHLSPMAFQVLSVPSSSADVERQFSRCGRLIKNRFMMEADTVCALNTCADHLNNEQ